MAIYQDKIFLSTYDAALVAIDMRSGKQVWRTVKADYKDAYTHFDHWEWGGIEWYQWLQHYTRVFNRT